MPPFCDGPAMAGKGGHAKSPMNEPDDKARIQDSASVWTDGSHQSFEQPGESTGPASVWKYGYGLDFKQQRDNKAKSQRAPASTATASTSSSSRTTRPRPSERLEVRLQPRLQALRPRSRTTRPRPSERLEVRLRLRLLQAQGQGSANVWKHGYGLSSRTTRPSSSERLEVRLRPRLQAAAGRKGQGPASVRHFFKQQPKNDKARQASGSTATPRLLPAAVRRQGKRPTQDGCDFFKQRPDHKAKAQCMPGGRADCECESSLLDVRMCIYAVTVHMLMCLSGHHA